MRKVSVLMPSLNVAPYIRECVESVLAQTLEEIEILCIDAGSTDGTLEILKEYAGRDGRLRVLEADKKSYGYQMNIGLREARGEYIGIVETDDFIAPEMYERLYVYAKRNNADFVKSDFDIFTTLEEGERIFLRYSLKRHSHISYDSVYTSKDFVGRKQTVDIFVWNGIYKTNFLKEKRIVFQETPGAAFQDCGFRYQTALTVGRGFFLEQSFYRYRRDNAASSTYNSRCVLFNLSECKNLIRIAKETGRDSREEMEFLARETAVIALAPYLELLTWGKPAEGTRGALEEFRQILKDFVRRGCLGRDTVTKDTWLELRMFLENPEFYDYYVRLRAEIAAETVGQFLSRARRAEQVVLFGSGYVGACVCCLLRNNGVKHVMAFCDNDKDKWGSVYIGRPVISPQEAAEQFPRALFVLTNAKGADEMKKQLSGYGMDEQQMLVYTNCSLMESTNVLSRRLGSHD